MSVNDRKRICIVISSPYTLEVFLVAQLRALCAIYDVTVVVNTHDDNLLTRLNIRGHLRRFPIKRKIALAQDALCLLKLCNILARERFDIVHSITPKAGLLTMAAGFFTKTPVRIHTFTGQVWGTRKGWMKSVLKLADELTASFATHILVDSESQRQYIVAEGIVAEAKATVLGNGSLNGVNIERFRPNEAARKTIRLALSIAQGAFVVLYMARLTRDKGAIAMAVAFAAFAQEFDDAHLIVVGPDEELLRPEIANICARCRDRVSFVDLVHVPENYMASADVLCLPSFREGFGNVLINASAAGIPVVASRIYGIVDAVEDNVTGFLFEVGDTDGFVVCLRKLKESRELRQEMGTRGRLRAAEKFSEELLTVSLLEFYRSRLAADGKR